MSSPPPPQPSYEELASLVVELKLLVSAQAERIAELERQIAADSHNSSKPPSSDGLSKKPAPKSPRRRSGRGPGRAREIRADGWSRSPTRTGSSITIRSCAAAAGPDSTAHEARAIGPVRSSTCPRSAIEAKDAVADAAAAGQYALARDTLTGFQARYRQAALCGIAANPRPGKGPKSKARALAERLLDRTEEYQRYMTDFTVPFDNNAAERDLRMVKSQQKISGSWRTVTGARRFARIRSYISTVRKHGINPLTALRDLFAGRPWTLPATS